MLINKNTQFKKMILKFFHKQKCEKIGRTVECVFYITKYKEYLLKSLIYFTYVIIIQLRINKV